MTATDGAQTALGLGVDVVAGSADKAKRRVGLGAGLAVGQRRALLEGGAEDGKQKQKLVKAHL